MQKLSHRWFAQPEWWTAIFSGILAVITVTAVWYARVQIRDTREEVEVQLKHAHEENQIQIEEARKEDQVQHLLVLVNEFDQEPMATYRKSLANKRLNTKNDDPLELYRVLDFFETVGRLVDRGYLNEEDVWSEFGYWVLNLNADSDMRANVEYEEKQNPNEYAVYLKLVARLQRIDAARGGNLANLSRNDILAFYREEAEIVGGTPITHGRSGRVGKQ
jgi:hypothetical protein